MDFVMKLFFQIFNYRHSSLLILACVKTSIDCFEFITDVKRGQMLKADAKAKILAKALTS